MARIRTIKPEAPQSKSLSRASREARLCFFMMFTLADDAGRLRGDSRLLASLLYPYDKDAGDLIDGWLDELVATKSIRRYVVDGEEYIDIPKWLEHQKIDRPSPSRLPAFSEAATKPREPVASVRDASPPDSKGREGNGVEQYAREASNSIEGPEPWRDLGERCCAAAGLDTGRLAVDFRAVTGWLTAGYDPELDILTTIRAVASRSGNGSIRGLSYFTNAIAETHRQRTNPLPATLRRDQPPPRKPMPQAEDVYASMGLGSTRKDSA